MTQDVQALAAQVVEAIRATPELAQRLVEAPAATVEKICGGNPGVDLTSLFMAVLDKLEGLDVDLSRLDLSRLDLDALDLSRLDPARLLSIATKLGIDVSKVDMGAIASKMLAGGGLGGLLGGLFGGR